MEKRKQQPPTKQQQKQKKTLPPKTKEMEEPSLSLDGNSALSEKLLILSTQMNKILLQYFVF